jgi:hypothetical protein
MFILMTENSREINLTSIFEAAFLCQGFTHIFFALEVQVREIDVEAAQEMLVKLSPKIV